MTATTEQFQFCIEQVALALGGVCCGGVDTSPEIQLSDPHSTTRVLVDAIKKLRAAAELSKYETMVSRIVGNGTQAVPVPPSHMPLCAQGPSPEPGPSTEMAPSPKTSGLDFPPIVHYRFTCKARKSVGANDPQDCNWPLCGCDPHADKVIETLNESGLCVVPDSGDHFELIQAGCEALKGMDPDQPEEIVMAVYEAMVERSQKP